MPPPLHPTKRSLSVKGLTEAIVALVGGATVLAFFGPLHWLLDLTSHFRPHYALVLGIAAGAMWARGARKQAITATAGFLVNAFVIAAATWQPRHATGEPVLRILYANVHTANANRQAIQTLARERNPDVIILSEVDQSWVTDLEPLREEYPYGITEAREDNFGLVLWSKISLTGTQALFMGSEQLPTVKATLETHRGTIALWGTHPLPPSSRENTEARNAQLRELAVLIVKEDMPTVLLGDLNTTPWNHVFRELTSRGLRSASRWYQATWPSKLGPFGIPLDHCLYTEGLSIGKLQVCRGIGSDHRPIIVEVSAAATPHGNLSSRSSNHSRPWQAAGHE